MFFYIENTLVDVVELALCIGNLHAQKVSTAFAYLICC